MKTCRFLTTRRSSGERTGGGDGAAEEIKAAVGLRAAADSRCGGTCRGGERVCERWRVKG
jgi:hypothetical protein